MTNNRRGVLLCFSPAPRVTLSAINGVFASPTHGTPYSGAELADFVMSPRKVARQGFAWDSAVILSLWVN